MQIGILSDTHGLLRAEVVDTLRGVDHILHAGDIGAPEVLTVLLRLAPVTAIRGNVDIEPPLAHLPATEMVSLGGAVFYLVHNIADLDLDPRAAGIDAVISGHSHRFSESRRNGVLYLNPGSVGPRRFTLPVSMCLARVQDHSIVIEQVDLPAPATSG